MSLAERPGADDGPAADKVVFLDGDKMESISFAMGTVTQLLINVEEERQLREADPYLRVQLDGKPQRAQPDIRLVLTLLFAARFRQYEVAWDHLAKVIECLQSHCVFERESSPDLPAGVERLTLELKTLGFAEQNEVWSALRTSYHPSLYYRARLVVVRDVRAEAREQVTQPVVVTVRSVS